MNHPSMIEKAKNSLIAAILQDMSPTIYRACENVVKPMITDIDQLPAICRLIGEVKPVTNENMAFYCAVILKVYSPIHLYFKGHRLPNGLRTKFIEHFGYNDEPIWNYWSDPVIPHMKNSRFANAVNDAANEVIYHLKTNGDLLDNIGCEAPSPHPFEKCENKKSAKFNQNFD